MSIHVNFLISATWGVSFCCGLFDKMNGTINLVEGEAIAPLSLQFRRPCVRELLLSKTLQEQKTFLCIVEKGKRNLLFFTLPFFLRKLDRMNQDILEWHIYSVFMIMENIFDCFRHFDNFDRAEKGSPNLVKNHGLTSHVQIGPWVHANTYRGNGNNNVFQPRNWVTMGWNPFWISTIFTLFMKQSSENYKNKDRAELRNDFVRFFEEIRAR